MIKLLIVALVLVSIATYIISSYPTITSFTIKEANKLTDQIADNQDSNLITDNVIKENNHQEYDNNQKNIEIKEQEINSGLNKKFNVSVDVIG